MIDLYDYNRDLKKLRDLMKSMPVKILSSSWYRTEYHSMKQVVIGDYKLIMIKEGHSSGVKCATSIDIETFEFYCPLRYIYIGFNSSCWFEDYDHKTTNEELQLILNLFEEHFKIIKNLPVTFSHYA
jgi:hypothetical protein